METKVQYPVILLAVVVVTLNAKLPINGEWASSLEVKLPLSHPRVLGSLRAYSSWLQHMYPGKQQGWLK